MASALTSTSEAGLSRLRIRTIVRLRWIAVIGQTLAVAGVYWGLGFDLPIVLCLLMIALSAWLNILLRIRYPARELLKNAQAATMLGYDIMQISALLYLTGGLQNPFAFLTIAPVIVSASTQPPRTTVLLAGLLAVCISLLTVMHRPLPWFPGEALTLPLLYVAGVWTALVSGAVFFSLYAWRIAKEARQMSDALAATEMVLMREQRLSALDGLAAAAAHELGTPLATISVVAKELLRELPADSPLREDAELLRSQSERCRVILGKLSQPADMEDALFAQAPITHLLEQAAEPCRGAGIQIAVSGASEDGATAHEEPVAARNPGMLYGFGNLIENAADFARSRVDVTARWDDSAVVVTIADDGPGIPPAVMERLGEPYVTTRPTAPDEAALQEEGVGLGLGFFIAKTLLERSGARLELRNRTRGEGAVVAVRWDREALAGSGET